MTRLASEPESAQSQYQLGIDIGGTFTDVALQDPTGGILTFKTPTRPDDPASGVSAALARLVDYGIPVEEIGYFVHGATIGLNSIIQRTGARTGLIVTRGFRDVLEFARLRLPIPYSFYSRRAEPLVPRERVLEVRERARYDGTIETALDDAEVARVVNAVAALAVDSVAICLLHSYITPAHELRLKHALAMADETLFVSCSCEIWPEIREYERALVTVMNAYVGPPTAAYLERLEEVLHGHNTNVRPYLTRSNGGIMTADVGRDEAVHLLLSGPASGVIGAAKVAADAGLQDVITFDMGGTSADIAVVEGGRVAYSGDERVAEFPVVVPSVAISSIGAGGGSIAMVDAAGVLKVGPASAGAEPGPACYGLGGRDATVTDAFLTCGYLDPHGFAGKDELDVSAANRVMRDLGRELGRPATAAGDGVLAVALANMYGEITSILERRGIDPRDFVLVAFGGAGPLVACMLAEEIFVPTVLFPPSPGTLCAFGALNADVMSDFVHTVNWRPPHVADDTIGLAVRTLTDRATAWLVREAPPVADSEVLLSADVRYVGQSYELAVPLPASPVVTGLLANVVSEFHVAHQKLFGQSDHQAPVEIISLRARAVGRLPSKSPAIVSGGVSGERREERLIRVRGQVISAGVYDRATLSPGNTLEGPAIVQQPDTTLLLCPGWSATMDDLGNMIAKHGVSAP
jgi:N-methylhydantoinase A